MEKEKTDNEKIREMIQEQIILLENSFIIEGVDVDERNKIVSFNKTHEKNVNTSILLNPTYDEIDGHSVISIFKRKKSKDTKLDGNPLVYALKGINGWHFKNPKEDIINLLMQFVGISKKIKPVYDTIITIPSENILNERFLHRLNRIIKSKHQITDWLFKLDATFVYENFINWKGIDKDFPNEYNVLRNQLNYMFTQMENKNKNIFSFKYIKNPELRKYIMCTMCADDEKTIEYASLINDEDILILDDTISSGTTISEACRIILKTYAPKSITIITLFSKL